MWVKENGSNNNTIIQTGKYLVLTNVSASDRGVYVCFAAVTPRKSIPSSHRNDVRQPLEVDEHEESKDENALESDTGTAQPTLELNEKNKNASTTSMLPMPSDDTGSVTSQSSSTFTPSKVTATASNSTPMPASASINNSSSNATTSPVTGVSSTNITSTTTSNSSSSISISHSSRSSSNSNNTTSSNSNNNSNSSSSLSELTTSSSLLPHSEVMPDGEDDDVIQEFQAFQKINLTVRTPPGPVSQLYFKASTILGFLVWRFNKTNSGGYPVRSFTAEFRNVSYDTPPYNTSFEHEWSRMDPINIAPNVRQMEVYRLEPNTTYEFRMWANNHLGSGEVVTTNVTTLPETKEEDLIRLIQPDLDNFDPRIWIVAVSIVLGTFVILAIGLCIVLTRECYQSSQAGTELNSICVTNASYQNMNSPPPMPMSQQQHHYPSRPTKAKQQLLQLQHYQPDDGSECITNQSNNCIEQKFNQSFGNNIRMGRSSSTICYNNHHHIVVIVDVVDDDDECDGDGDGDADVVGDGFATAAATITDDDGGVVVIAA
uniref:Fibronectin type-III domain-containing protein n=1 Tax=Stomoxys calcitrans TaxID=35570 RepID=A0A1I8PRJ9_STOCA